MLGQITGALSSLDPELREALADLITTRNEYLEQTILLNKLRIQTLQNPSPAGDKQIEDFASTVLAPVRRRAAEQMMKLIQQSVDPEQFKSMLPMAGLALMQAVNLPLLLNTLGLEPESIQELVGDLSKFFKSGL
ncbi:MAG TPA: hypothetical protein VG992_01150 [Candidatus Saccharimonadales bacterium]|nr:hypothetical protein [Candidatus Saccharimonadales bacterium]